MKKYLEEIFYLLGEDTKKLPVLVLLFLVLSMLDLAGLGLIGSYITLIFDPQALNGSLGNIVEITGLPKEQKSLANIIGLGLLGIFMIKAFSSIWINYKIISFSQNQLVRLRSFLMHAYQTLPYTEYLSRNSSEYLNSIGHLVGQFSGGIVISVLRTLSNGIVALAILGFLIWQNPIPLAFLVVILGIFLIVFDRIFRHKNKSYGKEVTITNATMVQYIQEGIEGIKVIRILGNESYFYNKVRDIAKKYARANCILQTIDVAPRFILELILFGFVILLTNSFLYFDQDIKTLLPTLGIFGYAGIRLIPTSTSIINSLNHLRSGRYGVSLLFKDIHSLKKLELKRLTTIQRIPNKFQTLSLNRVSYSYPNTKTNVLNKVSLELKAGESIGLIGPSGSGKTTLVDILIGLLEENEGEIYYNGRPLKEYMDDWRSQVAYLPQQVFLLDNTLRHNVALGIEDKEIDNNLLQEALRQSSLSELVETMPQGVNTVLGERGIRLSGGQRQRVALARAFYHGRNILVMDESTSSLDDETEHEIREEIRNLKGLKTIIIVAHRLTTIQDCDRIYRLDKEGRVIETSHSDIAFDSGNASMMA